MVRSRSLQVEKSYSKLASAAWCSGQYAGLLLIGSAGFDAALGLILFSMYLVSDVKFGMG